MPFFSPTGNRNAAGIFMLCLITGFTLSYLSPGTLFLDTTPTGGDMASHVYTAWYLKQNLLPNGQLSGWCMGNLGGFPMLENYFFLPFLFMALLSHAIPLPIAFKLMALTGVISLPWVTWFFFKLLRQPPEVALTGALASLVFLFAEGHSIWGGNILSTLAGTFCYGWGVSFALLFLGSLYSHFHVRPRPVFCAILLALTGFCHGYALLFAGFGSLFFLLYPRCFKTHLKSLILIHGLAVGLMAFWLFPLLAHMPYTSKFGFAWNFGGVHQMVSQVFPGLIRPAMLLTLGVLIAAIVHRFKNRHPDDTALVYVVYLSLAGLFLYSLGTGIKLVDVRFLPFFQFFLIIACAFAVNRIPQANGRSVFFMVFLVFSCFLWIHSRESQVRNWSFHNFKGWENTLLWDDFSSMARVIHGTGADPRIACEHSTVYENLGSIRAMESLPFFSGRNTLEGLYIQASLLSPFIYYIQAEISAHPSRPLEDYISPGTDLSRAVAHLKLFNVNQVILANPETQKAARSNPAYRLVHQSGPMALFELNQPPDSYVEPLFKTPALLSQGDFRRCFFTWFRNGDLDTPLIYLPHPGPMDLKRMIQVTPEDIPGLDTPELSGVRHEPRVDLSWNEILIDGATPHMPLLIKVSYHPGWSVDGADRIYLAAPGFMVVYPSRPQVRLHYGPTFAHSLGRAVSVLALVSIAVIWGSGLRRPAHSRAEPPPCFGNKRLLALGSAVTATLVLMLACLPSPSPVPRFLKAQALFTEKQYTRARPLFMELTQEYPDHSIADEALFHVALCDYLLEKWPQSRKVFDRLVKHYPESTRVPEALFHMALVCEKTGDRDQAATFFRTLSDQYSRTTWGREAQKHLTGERNP